MTELTGPGGIPVLPAYLDHGIDIPDELADYLGIPQSDREEIRRGRPSVPAYPTEAKMRALDRDRERRHAEDEQAQRDQLAGRLAAEWEKMTRDWPPTRRPGPPPPTLRSVPDHGA